MTLKKAFIISLFGSLVYLAFGWLVFDFMLGDYTEAHTTQLEGFKKNETEYSFLLLYISCLAYAALVTYVLVFLAKTQTLQQGFFRAAIIGVLVATMTDTFWYGSSHFYNDPLVMLADIFAAALSVGVLGFSVIWLNNRLDRIKGTDSAQ